MADRVLQASKNPHFFQPLLPGFESHLNIPIAFFSKHVKGRNEHNIAKLKSDVSDKAWEVKVEAGWRLTRGWKDFTTAHDFRIGDIIIFRHVGDLMFHVTALGPSCCEIEYTKSYNIDDDSDDHQENIEIKSRDKRAKKNPRREEDSSSDNSCFVASVSVSSLNEDRLFLPMKFVRSNDLMEGCCDEMVLKNEHGGTWNLVIRHHKSSNRTVISRGWRSFCQANGLKVRDTFRFKLARTGAKPVLYLYSAESNQGNDLNSVSTYPNSGEESNETEETEEMNSKDKGRDNIIVKDEESRKGKNSLRECSNIKKWKSCSRPGDSSSSSQSRFVTLTVTPYSFRSNKLRLPRHFTRVNGINKPGKITLLGQDGLKWMVKLGKDNKKGTMGLGRDWKGFCEFHGVRIGESFVLELIWKKDAGPVLKFCTKSNSV